METKEVNITYETLFELLRREKSRKDLQKLPDTFFIDALSYLNEKTMFVKQKKDELFDADERDKTSKQVENIKQILKDLYQRREKKIIEMALNKSRTENAIIDSSSLLKEEEQLFNSLLELLNKNRKDIISNLLQGIAPSVKIPESQEQPEEKQEQEEKDTVKLEIKDFVEKFIGLDLKEYGPFEDGDEVDLPKEIAQILLKREKAVKI